jgi:hypothetical protein
MLNTFLQNQYIVASLFFAEVINLGKRVQIRHATNIVVSATFDFTDILKYFLALSK